MNDLNDSQSNIIHNYDKTPDIQKTLMKYWEQIYLTGHPFF